MTWSLLPPVLADTGSSGIDQGTFWLIVSALGGALSTVAGMLYKSERDRRIKCEEKLDEFQKIAPDLAENVRWLVDRAGSEGDLPPLPWPYGRTLPRRGPRSPIRRRSR